MANTELIEVTKDHFDALADLIAQQCKDPQTQCIHSSTGEDAESILSEMNALYDKDELAFVIARQGDLIVGAIGCEYDCELGRGWLRGPFVLVEEWEALAGDLLSKLREILPSEIKRLDTYFNVENQRGNAFYEAQGFTRTEDVHVFEFYPPMESPEGLCQKVLPEEYEAAAKLHDTLFPKTFINGKGLIDSLDEDHLLFVAIEDGTVAGYAYVEIDRHMNEGFITFLGVDEKYRRKGYATCLLQTGLHWFFADRDMPKASLTVNERNPNALALYEKAGFELRYTGVNTRQE